MAGSKLKILEVNLDRLAPYPGVSKENAAGFLLLSAELSNSLIKK